MIQHSTTNWLVSYADTDAGGVVYHGRYIEQAERSRQQLLLDAELSFSALEREYDCLLVVRAIDASYEPVSYTHLCQQINLTLNPKNGAGREHTEYTME